jgi:glycosyltransferase involved in cell wall biosynthesis
MPPKTDHPASAAFYFAADDYTAGEGVMGRQVAGEEFLKAYFRYAAHPHFDVYAHTRDAADAFAARALAERQDASIRWTPAAALGGVTEAGALMFPSPAIAQFAWRREPIGRSAFSIFGITHALSAPAMIEQLHALLSAPLAPWDALICTSRAVRDVVAAILEPMAHALQRDTLPNLPIIPLGVDADRFAHKDAHRQYWRTRLSIPDDAIVLLSLGRLSFHAKAHPIPLYLALERAAQQTHKRLHLIEAGWFAQAELRALYAQARAALAPSIVCHQLDGQDEAVKSQIRAAADIFISLPDNIQETFGLTPLEAMAAGLACIVSDWNGYRETVRDGVDGFRIPTYGAPSGLGVDVADRLAGGIDDGDHFLARVSQTIVVDIEAAAQRVALLADNETLRRACGSAGLRHVQATYDWRRIIPAYETLWSEMRAVRKAATTIAPAPNFAMPDPFRIYAHYATSTLTPDWRVRATPRMQEIDALYAAPFTLIGPDLILPHDALHALAQHIVASSPTTVSALLAQCPEAQRPLAARTLLWLAKWGCIDLTPPHSPV